MELFIRKEQHPLDPNETEGLLLTHITTRAQLDRWNRRISMRPLRGWNHGNQRHLQETLSETTHKRMFGSVWKWGGDFSTVGIRILGLPGIRFLLH